MEFKNKNMKFKCIHCGKERKTLATALEHRDFDNNGRCSDAGIVTPETIEKWNRGDFK